MRSTPPNGVPLALPGEVSQRYRVKRDTMGGGALKILGAVFAGVALAVTLGTVVVKVATGTVSRAEYDRKTERTEDQLDSIERRMGSMEGVQQIQTETLKSLVDTQQKMDRKLDAALRDRRRR